ncbi:MAG: hypothetical protein ACRECI_05270 [Methyloceanibacter sp.]
MADSVSKSDLDRALKQRDLVFLSDQVGNDDLSPKVRSHLAAIIRGLLTREIKIPNHRPPVDSSKKNTWKIALRVFELRRSGWDKMSAAIKQAQEEFKCSETKVWTSLRKFRGVLRASQLHLDNWYDDWREERQREERREEEQREEERQEEERREEEWRERCNEAEAYLIETEGQRAFTDKEIEDVAVLFESGVIP